jgi:putative endonuclease
MFVTYVLFSPSLGKHYVGHTDDLTRRLDEHRRGESRWTSRASDWQPVYTKRFHTREAASRQERRIKKEGAPQYLRAWARHPQRSEG